MTLRTPHATTKSAIVDTVSSKGQNNFWFLLKMLWRLLIQCSIGLCISR